MFDHMTFVIAGSLVVLNSLDREDTPTYSIHVSATDGQQTSEAIINIIVTDVNDQTPVFTNQWYSFDIEEDARTGTTVGQVSAVDMDTGHNSDLSYAFVSHWGRDIFSLDPKTGVLTLIGRLDYEQVCVVNVSLGLAIQPVTDHGVFDRTSMKVNPSPYPRSLFKEKGEDPSLILGSLNIVNPYS